MSQRDRPSVSFNQRLALLSRVSNREGADIESMMSFFLLLFSFRYAHCNQ
jgi:hypothetical protein